MDKGLVGESESGMPSPIDPGPAVGPRPPSVRVFVCYARSDNQGGKTKRGWRDRLMQHLGPFERQGVFSVFYDERTRSGEEWAAWIRHELETCRVAVLMVSTAFLNSEDIRNQELPILLRRHEQGLVRLIPVVVGVCAWDQVTFRYWDAVGREREKRLSELQGAFPSDKPLASLRGSGVDAALKRVAEEVAGCVRSGGSEGRMRQQVVVSYHHSDRAWAEAIARDLSGKGYVTGMRVWSVSFGTGWAAEMEQALESCDRVVALLSPSYGVPRHAAADWASKHGQDPLGKARALIPVLLRPCDPGELRNERGFCDLVGLDDAEAIRVVTGRVETSLSEPAVAAVSRPAVQSLPSRGPVEERSVRVGGRTRSLPAGPLLAHVQEMIRVGRLPDLLLHTFYGLSPAPIREAPLSYTSVYYLWADAEGGSISATLEPKEPGPGEGRYFVVKFENAPGTYSGNVAFRPGGMSALDNASPRSGPNRGSRRYLAFEARRPEPETGGLRGIAMSYRIIDRLGTHWTLKRGARVEVVGSSEWATFGVDMAHDGWSVFTSDGNYLYADRVPDFSLVVAVVIDFGSDEGEGRLPGSGRGVVHLRDFRLTDGPLAKGGGRGENENRKESTHERP